MILSAVRQKIHPRKIQAFNIGAPKTGTTFIASIFDQNYHAAHEPESKVIVDKMYKHYNHQLTDDNYIIFLKKKLEKIMV